MTQAFVVIVVAFYAFVWTTHEAKACSYDSLIKQEAVKHGLPADALIDLAMAESSCNPKAIGDNGTAYGLFQITKSTWTRYTHEPFINALNPERNIAITMKHLDNSLFKSDYRNIFSYHNANVKDWHTLNPKWSINHPNRIYRAWYRGNGKTKGEADDMERI